MKKRKESKSDKEYRGGFVISQIFTAVVIVVVGIYFLYLEGISNKIIGTVIIIIFIVLYSIFLIRRFKEGKPLWLTAYLKKQKKK